MMALRINLRNLSELRYGQWASSDLFRQAPGHWHIWIGEKLMEIVLAVPGNLLYLRYRVSFYDKLRRARFRLFLWQLSHVGGSLIREARSVNKRHKDLP